MYQRSKISFVRIHGKSEGTFLCQEELKPLIFFMNFCEHLLTNKHKTKLADLSCQRQQALFFLDSQGIGCKYSSYWQTLIQRIVSSITKTPTVYCPAKRSSCSDIPKCYFTITISWSSLQQLPVYNQFPWLPKCVFSIICRWHSVENKSCILLNVYHSF